MTQNRHRRSGSDPSKRQGSSRGVSMVEVIVVLALFALVLGITALALHTAQRPLSMAVEMMQSQFQQVRTQAMATTTAYRIVPLSDSLLSVESGLSCGAATWRAEPSFYLQLPERVSITAPQPLNWNVCFDTRGLASANLTITLAHPQLGSQEVEVLLGGSLREL